MEKALLTIAVITYNRKIFLKRFLDSVISEIELGNYQKEVELLINDNCSNDGTNEMVEEYIKNHSTINVKYFVNKTNIGSVKNLVTSLKNSTGTFWMLYGDDDEMVQNSLGAILKSVKNNPEKISFYFRKGVGNKEFSLLNFSEKFFYQFGNAGGFIIHTKKAQEVLTQNYESIISTCWPQTEIAFRVMANEKNKFPIIAVDLETVQSPNHLGNSNYNSWYVFETAYYSLLRVAINCSDNLGGDFIHHAAKGMHMVNNFKLFIQFCKYSAYTDTPSEINNCIASVKEAIIILPKPYKDQAKMVKFILEKLPVFIKKIVVKLYYLKNPLKYRFRMNELLRQKNSQKDEVNFSNSKEIYGK